MSDPDKDKKKPELQTEEIADAVIVEDEDLAPEEVTEPEQDDDDDAGEQDPAPEPDEPEMPEQDIAQIPTSTTEEPRKGGFLPLVLGGVLAAGLGFGASKLVFPDGWPGAGDSEVVEQLQDSVGKQASAIAALEQRLTDAEGKAAPDNSAEIGALNDTLATLDAAMRQLSTKLETFDSRLTDLEKRPVAEGASSVTVEAYEREVRALKEAMDQQKSEIQDLVSAAEREKASAEMAAQKAMVRSAVSRIQVALDTGAGFADALADLKDAAIAVPSALGTVAENGAPTQAQLAAGFPEAARLALAAARKAEGNSGSIWNFVRNQLGVRSLQPKEGSDADAILSRAEAALSEGRLTDVLAELQGLPEEGRVELTAWMARANQRAAALAAAEELSAQVAMN
ncbi:hypothetical protein [Thalassovita sp.]|uniref:COG4223 family protein n=1 Tax=Thalassovita sp. TaxID=1979401 RepID=UPI0029DE8A09|nr:hypothetical protein [Thalassovita sp.]